MRNTKRQFLKLGDYIVRKFDVQLGQEFVSNKLGFMMLPNGYAFVFYKIGVIITDQEFKLDLPDHIDIRDFDASWLLKDMWQTIHDITPVKEQTHETRDRLVSLVTFRQKKSIGLRV